MGYVDGFVLAVHASNKERYLEHSSIAAKLFKEYGATRVVECWGDDVPEGKVTDFRKSVQAEDGEVVVYGWIEYPSKDVRDRANAGLWKDPRMKEIPAMPFDGKRMVFGGFQVIFDE